MSWKFIIISSLAALLSPFSALAEPSTDGIRGCTADQTRYLAQARSYLQSQERRIQDFEFDYDVDFLDVLADQKTTSEQYVRHFRAEVTRDLPNLEIQCIDPSAPVQFCGFGQAAYHQGSLFDSDLMRICPRALNQERTFCEWVGLISHEFGHTAGVPMERWRKHGERGYSAPDHVYQFGLFNRDACTEAFANVTRTNTPGYENGFLALKYGLDRDTGIVLRQTDGEHGRHFDIARGNANDGYYTGQHVAWLVDASRAFARHYTPNNDGIPRTFLDLRFVGRNDSTSQVEILYGSWTLCADVQMTGFDCIILEEQGTHNLADYGFDNKLSSFAPTPRSGLMVSDLNDPLMKNRTRTITADLPDLAKVGLNDAIKSVQALGGDFWEVCKGKHYTRGCLLIDPSRSHYDLEDHGFSDGVSSIRKVPRGAAATPPLRVNGRISTPTGLSLIEMEQTTDRCDSENVHFEDKDGRRVPLNFDHEILIPIDGEKVNWYCDRSDPDYTRYDRGAQWLYAYRPTGPDAMRITIYREGPPITSTAHPLSAATETESKPPAAITAANNRNLRVLMLANDICHKAVQGKIAWNYAGSTKWSDANIKALCVSATDAKPAECFNMALHGGVTRGDDSKWTWQDGIALCKGARNPTARISCFENATVLGAKPDAAIKACQNK